VGTSELVKLDHIWKIGSPKATALYVYSDW
jgi:hypothetical protein